MPATVVDPRGLVDTCAEEVNPETAQLARQLAAGSLAGLTELALKKAGLATLPPQIGELASLRKLDLSLNPLSTLPPEVGQLGALRILFCLGTRFSSMPTVLGGLPSLYMLSFKSNQLVEIPEDALAPTVAWLILTDNRLEALPRSIGRCALRKLMLTNNRLASLPAELTLCRELEMVRLADNQLSTLPDGLLQLPKLAWMGLAGNPLVAHARPGAPPRWVPFGELEVGELVGSGGGGFVHRARWAEPGGGVAREVALKLFRDAGTVTDGDPAHEIDLGPALTHPNVIQVLGATPRPKLGLVLELLDVGSGQWRELGKPPNFDTCTRDTYDAAAAFAAEPLLRTLACVACACAHLHAAGFTHGDLYAHNTMVRADGEAKVGDFGAAYHYGAGHFAARGEAGALERIEVRAFGCLVEELAARMAPAAVGDVARRLGELAARCVGEEVCARPSFAELAAELLPSASSF